MIKTIKLKIPKELQKAFDDPDGLFRKHFSKGIGESAREVQREARKNVIPGWNMGHDSGPAGNVFEGRLNRSITYEMINPLKAVVGANTIYAAIQEYGGIIRPKTAKALFVPTSRRGRKVGPSRTGNSGLVYGDDFIFMQRVEIVPKRYFERGINSAMKEIEKIMQEAVETITKVMGFK